VPTSTSVVLCTHNPRTDYLRRALDALRGQTLPLAKWELLVIDNASRDRLADAWDISWHPRGRHIREDELGLTVARLRGIREARGGLLVFVDDDNVLGADFLEQATAIQKRHPYLGAFGPGTLEPEFEVPPPSELSGSLSLLALRTVSAALWTNHIRDFAAVPWGAGLCVTRHVSHIYRQLVDQLNVTTVLGRRGQQLFAGEDNIFSWASVRAGQGFGLFPELRVTHLISAGRLTQRYFLRLIHGHAFSHGVLNYLLMGVHPPTIRWLRYVHLLLHGIRNGRFSMRSQWAASRGEGAAARFIAANRLRPIGSFPSNTEAEHATSPPMLHETLYGPQGPPPKAAPLLR